MRAKVCLAFTIVLFLAVGVYAIMPTPEGGLSEQFPHSAVLSKYKGSGCGLSTLDHASETKWYENLKLSPAERRSLDLELTAQGFTYEAEKDAYVRRTGGIFPIKSYVGFKPTGIYAGCRRNKCPFK